VGRSVYDEKRLDTRYDIFESDPNVIYVGYGELIQGDTAPGPSNAVWTIRKITFSNGNPILSQWTLAGAGEWDSRTVEVYA
jgi:hypothetical protein